MGEVPLQKKHVKLSGSYAPLYSPYKPHRETSKNIRICGVSRMVLWTCICVLIFVYVNMMHMHYMDGLMSNTTWLLVRSTLDTAPSLDLTRLSVLVLTYNNPHMLHQLLDSLVSTPLDGYVDMEVIIGDNGCLGPTMEVCSNIQRMLSGSSSASRVRVKYVPLCDNAPYAVAYNNLSTYVSPSVEWMLLLNDDVLPQPGFIQNFHHVVDSYRVLNRKVGAIGCKLLFPHHRIVEAGSVILSNGHTDNYLRDAEPCNVQARHVRDIHYESAACLFVKANAFKLAGGFDAGRYKAYFEDTHLQMHIRHKQGLHILYSPFSQATHYEHATFGKENTQTLMATSREKFSLHWLNELSSRHPPITTTATSSGALSAHLLSRDASVCTATRVLLTATVVELIIFGEQLLSLQASGEYTFTVLIAADKSRVNDNGTIKCESSPRCSLLTQIVNSYINSENSFTHHKFSMERWFTSTFLRMLRTCGVEVLWTEDSKLQSKDNTPIWNDVEELLTSYNSQTFVRSGNYMREKGLNNSDFSTIEKCFSDVDDCDCATGEDAGTGINSKLTLDSILEERQGFYHIVMASRLGPSTDQSNSVLNVHIVAPHTAAKMIRTSSTKADETAHTSNTYCGTLEGHPLFMELRIDPSFHNRIATRALNNINVDIGMYLMSYKSFETPHQNSLLKQRGEGGKWSLKSLPDISSRFTSRWPARMSSSEFGNGRGLYFTTLVPPYVNAVVKLEQDMLKLVVKDDERTIYGLHPKLRGKLESSTALDNNTVTSLYRSQKADITTYLHTRVQSLHCCLNPIKVSSMGENVTEEQLHVQTVLEKARGEFVRPQKIASSFDVLTQDSIRKLFWIANRMVPCGPANYK